MISPPSFTDSFPSQWQSARGRLRLYRILRRLNAGGVQRGCRSKVHERLQFPVFKLAVYGTLRPGASNHHMVAELPGEWTKAAVRGRMIAPAPAAKFDHPGMVWQPEGDEIAVDLLVSAALEHYWRELDEFEGEDYHRILVPVEKDDQIITIANLYEILTVSEAI